MPRENQLRAINVLEHILEHRGEIFQYAPPVLTQLNVTQLNVTPLNVTQLNVTQLNVTQLNVTSLRVSRRDLPVRAPSHARRPLAPPH